MDDRGEELLHQIVSARGGFGHREHLELAWNYLAEYPDTTAETMMASAIRALARGHGALDRYHETMTRSWVRLVAIHRGAGEASSFEDFIEANDGLLDRGLLQRHYSPDLLWSDRARGGWVAPDLRPLPTHA